MQTKKKIKAGFDDFLRRAQQQREQLEEEQSPNAGEETTSSRIIPFKTEASDPGPAAPPSIEPIEQSHSASLNVAPMSTEDAEHEIGLRTSITSGESSSPVDPKDTQVTPPTTVIEKTKKRETSSALLPTSSALPERPQSDFRPQATTSDDTRFNAELRATRLESRPQGERLLPDPTQPKNRRWLPSGAITYHGTIEEPHVRDRDGCTIRRRGFVLPVSLIERLEEHCSRPKYPVNVFVERAIEEALARAKNERGQEP